MKNLYFISESIPHPGYGSFVIFYRHLIRLEKEGYNINLIIPDYKRSDADEFLTEVKDRWNIIKVPFKKWWFLFPYRYNNKLLRDARFWFVNLYLKKHFRNHHPDFIITYFYNQFFNGLAAFIKTRYKSHLGIFLHDDKYLLNNQQVPGLLEYDQYLSEKADVIWTVSEDLIIPHTDKKKYRLLYPIPAGAELGISNWTDNYQTPVIGFSGNIFHEYEEVFRSLAVALANFNGRLILVINNPSYYKWLPALIAEYSNIQLTHAFADVNDTFNYLKENCTALFCGYPNNIELMPWLRTCFPSKFIEFSHLGLPIILTSPTNTALSKWTAEHNWQLFSSDYHDADFDELLKKITNENDWTTNARQSVKISDTIFNPENIHLQLLTDIKHYA